MTLPEAFLKYPKNGGILNLFSYGTLMNSDVQRKVLGRTLPSQPAELYGYTLIRTRADFGDYPIAVRQANASVQGLLLSELTEEDFLRIDAYEGIGEENCPYHRRTLRVITEGGRRVPADVYVGGKKPAPRPEWNVFDL